LVNGLRTAYFDVLNWAAKIIFPFHPKLRQDCFFPDGYGVVSLYLRLNQISETPVPTACYDFEKI